MFFALLTRRQGPIFIGLHFGETEFGFLNGLQLFLDEVVGGVGIVERGDLVSAVSGDFTDATHATAEANHVGFVKKVISKFNNSSAIAFSTGSILANLLSCRGRFLGVIDHGSRSLLANGGEFVFESDHEVTGGSRLC